MTIRQIRELANGILIVLAVVFIVTRLTTIGTTAYHWLWGLPAILVSALSMHFLLQSLLEKPKEVDAAPTTFFISVIASLGFLFSALVIHQPIIDFPLRELLRRIGGVMAMLPYPFVIWALLCLRKCLTIIPEAHSVVANGIYKYSRHPLYVCYMVWAVANMLMFPSIPVITVSILHIVFLFLRLKREEKLLLATFPEYRGYYQKTGLIGKKQKRAELS